MRKTRKKSLETIGTRIDPDLREKLEAIAEREERSISALVRIAIREFIVLDEKGKVDA
jgi:predicted transcriptional regulator